MPILSVTQTSTSYGPRAVLSDVSFVLHAGDRVGLVGANGAGKSTLLRIVAREIEPEAGCIRVQPGVAVGYLPQQPPDPGDASFEDLILDAVGDVRRLESRLRALEACMATPGMSAAQFEAALSEYGECQERFERGGGYDIGFRIDMVLAGLRIDHLPRERAFNALSGGEKARVMLAALLLRAPDLLLLDEPTNHLDFASIAWLEEYLSTYRGTLLIVSHDRHLLNRTVTRILEIDEHSHQLKEYIGDYAAYAMAKRRELERWELDWRAQQEELRELKRAIRVTARQIAHNRPPRDGDKTAYDFFGGRVQGAISRNVRNLEERLRRIEDDPIPKPPDHLRINPEFDIDPLRGDAIIRFERVSKTFGDQRVLGDVSFTLGPRDRVVIVGPNGAGKSTLLNLLAGRLAADAGRIVVAPGARLGYLDQDAADLDTTRTVLDVFRDGLVGYEDGFIRDLFRFGLFTRDDLSTQVRALSAGQRRKLQIARLVAQRANVLLLDEPTNHLAFDIVEEFERALAGFPGPVLAVSHDRRFIQRFGGAVWEMRAGRLSFHHGRARDALATMLAGDSVVAND